MSGDWGFGVVIVGPHGLNEGLYTLGGVDW